MCRTFSFLFGLWRVLTLVLPFHSRRRSVCACVSCYRIRVLSIEPSPPVHDVLAANVMPALVEFLSRHDHQELQFEAAWALTNIASTDQTRKVSERDLVRVALR